MGNLEELKFRVAFSGGGFRATFYCLGAFRRLVELKLADKIVSISSVSGGSIAAGAIMKNLPKSNFNSLEDFDEKVAVPLKRLGQSRLREWITWPVYIIWFIFTYFYIFKIAPFINSIITPLCPFNISSCIILIDLSLYAFFVYFFLKPTRFFSRFFSFALYMFFKKERMYKLQESPEWSANATCLNTGKRFRFKRNSLGGYNVGVTGDNKDISVSFAVACSAAFPPVFAPFKLGLQGREFRYRPYDNPTKNQESVLLTDGGVYDNLGSEPLLNADNSQRSKSDVKEHFIVLDAGEYISSWSSEGHWFANTGRIIASALDQIICLRRRLIYRETLDGMPGILLILGRSAEEYVDNGAVSKRGLEREFSDGGKIFDWLMKNGYFEETSGEKAHLKSFTEDSVACLQKKYPDRHERILVVLKQMHNVFGRLRDVVVAMPEYKELLDLGKAKIIDGCLPDLRTDLDGFHDIEIDSLMWAGAVRMDIAIKRYLRDYVPVDMLDSVPETPKYSAERIKEILLKGRRESKWITLLGFLHWHLHERGKGISIKERISKILSCFKRKG